MTISAINSCFGSRRDKVDALVNMDENEIQNYAYYRTLNKVNRNKSHKITNALFYAAPLAAGLRAAVLGGNKPSKIFSTELTGLAARTSRGLKVAALWTAALGALDLLSLGNKKLAENSYSVRKFDNEHPFLSLGAILALGYGVISLVNKGAIKLGALNAPRFMRQATKKVGEFLNADKLIASAKNIAANLKSKTHPVVKDIGATVLYWSPTALLLGGLFHSINSSHKVSKEFFKNYNELKDEQHELTKKRVLELSLQNDFLMQDPANREAIELLENPLNRFSAKEYN